MSQKKCDATILQQSLDQRRNVRLQFESQEDAKQIDELLGAAPLIANDEDRFRFLVQPFLQAATPYRVNVPEPEPGVVHIDLSSFHCATFVFLLTALYCAKNLEEFAWAVQTMQHRDSRISPKSYYYITNVMTRILAANLATDVTDTLVSSSAMRTRTVELGVHEDGQIFLKALQRPEFQDGSRPLLTEDSGPGQTVSLRYMHASAISAIEPLLKCGDVLFLVSVEAPEGNPELIIHCGFAYKFDGDPDKTFLLHSSAIEWSELKKRRGGVCIANFPDWSREARRAPGRHCRVHEYLEKYSKRFEGLVVLRPHITLRRDENS